jgi:hypothetical protein
MRSWALMMSIAAQRGGDTSFVLAGSQGDLQEKWDGETWGPLFRILERVARRFAAGWETRYMLACPAAQPVRFFAYALLAV